MIKKVIKIMRTGARSKIMYKKILISIDGSKFTEKAM